MTATANLKRFLEGLSTHILRDMLERLDYSMVIIQEELERRKK